MGYLVVTDQSDLEAVAAGVLKARLDKKARASALDAIRNANPELDFSRLTPGAVVRIPAVDGLLDDAHVDGLDATLGELLGAAVEALKRLVSDTNDAHEANNEERSETRRLLESEVGQLAERHPVLKEGVESVLKTLEADSIEERETSKHVGENARDWARQLEKLRTL